MFTQLKWFLIYALEPSLKEYKILKPDHFYDEFWFEECHFSVHIEKESDFDWWDEFMEFDGTLSALVDHLYSECVGVTPVLIDWHIDHPDNNRVVNLAEECPQIIILTGHVGSIRRYWRFMIKRFKLEREKGRVKQWIGTLMSLSL